MHATHTAAHSLLHTRRDTLLTPLHTQYNIHTSTYSLLHIGCAILLQHADRWYGSAEGVSLPCIHQITADWIPLNERSRFLTACTSGQFVGTLAAMTCAPFVEEWWPSIFYLFGGLGLVWSAVWYCVASSTPEIHPTICDDELTYIQQGREAVDLQATVCPSAPTSLAMLNVSVVCG